MFPYIERIEDVLPHIQGRDEFVVAQRDGHTIINYNVCFADTFPPLLKENHPKWAPDEEDYAPDYTALVRRECRGIIFDSDGKIIRRPLEKFFNLGEREETALENLPNLMEGMIMDKLDGSMIAPYFTDKDLIWGTKMGDTDVAKKAAQYASLPYLEFATHTLDEGYTPIFEFVAPTNRIILHYSNPKLILLAVRNIKTGEYMSRPDMEFWARKYGIPVVNVWKFGDDAKKFIEMVKNAEDVEGYVVQLPDQSKVKIKCDWYVRLHKTMEHLLHEKDVIRLLLNNQLDDAKQILPPEMVQALDLFNDTILDCLKLKAATIHWKTIEQWDNSNGSRKQFALWAKELPHSMFYFKALDFILSGEENSSRLYNYLIDFVRDSCSSQTKVNEIRHLWGGLKWEDLLVQE